MTQRFLAIGECMIELSPHGDDMYGMAFAGDTLNTAWYLRRVATDLEVSYLTAVGDDSPSQKMVQFMRDAGIDPIVQTRAGRSVGLYMVTLKDGERSFSYWRDTSAARSLADDLAALPVSKGDIAYFSGITLAILAPEARTRLLERLTEARAQGARVAFDPNLRPRLWEDAQSMLDWTTHGASVSDIVLPSYDDESVHFGDANPAETAERYQRAGASLIVVKNGPDAVLVTDGSDSFEVTPKPVTSVVDTTAAGDSFNAQFFASHMEGKPLNTAVADACALSSQVISRLGALVSV